MVYVSFDGSLHLGVDNVEDGLDEVVFVAVQHICQVTSHLWIWFLKWAKKDQIRDGKTFWATHLMDE